MNECVIYIPHISHHVSWRFTILLSDIERQLVKVPLATAISPCLVTWQLHHEATNNGGTPNPLQVPILTSPAPSMAFPNSGPFD